MQENSIAMCKFRISKLYWKSLKMMVKIKRNLWNKFASFEAQVTSYKINKKKIWKGKGESELETHHRKEKEARGRVDSVTCHWVDVKTSFEWNLSGESLRWFGLSVMARFSSTLCSLIRFWIPNFLSIGIYTGLESERLFI